MYSKEIIMQRNRRGGMLMTSRNSIQSFKKLDKKNNKDSGMKKIKKLKSFLINV